jgi:CO dehydrogenase maturation factor
MRLAVVGKGGAGKSVVSATIARTLARRGRSVLALDSDSLPGLTFSLGADPAPEEPPLNAAVQRGEDKRWHFVEGLSPVAAVQRYATQAPDGVRLLQVAKTPRAGLRPIDAAVNAFYMIIHELEHAPEFGDWVILGDLPAGGRQTAMDWAPYAGQFLLVVEPTWQSMLTARRIRRIAAGSRPDASVALVVNKVTAAGDADRVAAFLELPVAAAVPVDEGIRLAERAGLAALDAAPDSRAVRAITRLAEQLETRRS